MFSIWAVFVFELFILWFPLYVVLSCQVLSSSLRNGLFFKTSVVLDQTLEVCLIQVVSVT